MDHRKLLNIWAFNIMDHKEKCMFSYKEIACFMDKLDRTLETVDLSFIIQTQMTSKNSYTYMRVVLCAKGQYKGSST